MTTGVLSQLPANATVAIVRLRSLGDTVLTTPAIALLKQARPDLRIVAVVERPFDALLESNPDIARVLCISRSAGLTGKWNLLRQIRRERPILCLNLHGGSTSAWLTALSGARFRAGFGHFRHGFLYNVSIPRAQEILGRATNAAVHTAEHLASAVFYLGVPASEIPRARLFAAPADASPADAAHSETDPATTADSGGVHPAWPKRPYAVLHVTAAYFTKQWAASRFRQVAEFLRTRGLEPVILAGPGEEAIFEEFAGFTCFAGRPLGWVQSLIAGAALFVGNDSGPAHIAAAFAVPTVVIFGSSNSAVWYPWKTAHAVVETSWDCKPCPGDRCYAFDEPRCILSVEVDAVRAAIERVLAEMPHNQRDSTNPEGRSGRSSDASRLT